MNSHCDVTVSLQPSYQMIQKSKALPIFQDLRLLWVGGNRDLAYLSG